jgi:hypothetical protein
VEVSTSWPRTTSDGWPACRVTTISHVGTATERKVPSSLLCVCQIEPTRGEREVRVANRNSSAARLITTSTFRRAGNHRSSRGIVGLHRVDHVDWGDVQVGDPAWDLAVAACHFTSSSEGLLHVHHGGRPDLFPCLLEGYEPSVEIAQRLDALGSFYLAYRRAWVARLGPGAGGVPNPSLAALRAELDADRRTDP